MELWGCREKQVMSSAPQGRHHQVGRTEKIKYVCGYLLYYASNFSVHNYKTYRRLGTKNLNAYW